MGNPKQKWTSEEEEALRAGVRKHGTGKWKDIQKDPEFNPHLANRSNIDLKDKWRNMSVATQGPREKPKPKSKETPATLFAGPQPSAAAAAAAAAASTAAAAAVTVAIAPTKHESATVPVKREPATVPAKREPATAPVKGEPVTVEESTGISETITAPECNAMIFEALKSAESKGMDTSTIASFIEQTNEVPQNFRKVLSTRLRRLVQQEKLEKVQTCFKIKSASSRETSAPPTPIQKDSLPVHKQNDAPPAPKPNDVQPKQLQSPADVIDKISSETVEDAAVQAAYRIAEAENKSFVAEEAVKESERVSRMFDDTNSMLQLAEEFLKKCSQGEVLLIS